MRDRIFGIETEYALANQLLFHKGISDVDGEDLRNLMQTFTTKLLKQLAICGYVSCGEFLSSGGRLYMDRGGHPEYATPECRSVIDLVAHEKAGDQILQELLMQACESHIYASKKPYFHLFKNNVDCYGNTYGCHENYLVTEKTYGKIDTIIPFLVTRQIYTGAGKVCHNVPSKDLVFQISQRADFFERVYSDRTSKVRGIINTRRREILRQGEPRRFHLILGDSNMSEIATALKVGTTHLLLCMLEEEYLIDAPELSSPIESLKEISLNPSTALKFCSRRGKWTALDIQCEYLERSLQFFASRSPTKEEKLLMKIWEEVLCGLKHVKFSSSHCWLEDDPGELCHQLDWVLKLRLITQYTKGQRTVDKNKIKRIIDFFYHDINPTTGLYKQCEKLGLVQRLIEDRKIEAAKTVPPNNTRAQLRSFFIRLANRRNIMVTIDGWDKVRIRPYRKKNEPEHHFDWMCSNINNLVIPLEDPFEFRNKQKEKLINKFFGV